MNLPILGIILNIANTMKINFPRIKVSNTTKEGIQIHLINNFWEIII